MGTSGIRKWFFLSTSILIIINCKEDGNDENNNNTLHWDLVRFLGNGAKEAFHFEFGGRLKGNAFRFFVGVRAVYHWRGGDRPRCRDYKSIQRRPIPRGSVSRSYYYLLIK